MNTQDLIQFYCLLDPYTVDIYTGIVNNIQFQQLKRDKTSLQDFELLLLIFQSYKFLNQIYNQQNFTCVKSVKSQNLGQVYTIEDSYRSKKQFPSLEKMVPNSNTQQNETPHQLLRSYIQSNQQIYLNQSPNQAQLQLDFILQYINDIISNQTMNFYQIFNRQVNEVQPSQLDQREVDQIDETIIYNCIKVIDKNLKTHIQDWILQFISNLISQSILLVRIDPIHFLDITQHNGYNFLLEVFTCRRFIFNAFESNKVNLSYINPTIFNEQILLLNKQKQQENQNKNYSTLISCRYCKAYKVTFSLKQTSLSLDELCRVRCVCDSCKRTFIV